MQVLQRVKPRCGRVVHFDGRLLHGIASGRWSIATPRVSVV